MKKDDKKNDQPDVKEEDGSCEANEPASGVCFATSPEVRPEYCPEIPGHKMVVPEKPKTEDKA
ncbi:MAG: hypothetical protein WA004_03335 [Saprospiraceae bacterium]